MVKQVCVVLAVNSDTSFDMLGCGGHRIQTFPPWKVNSLNESSDVVTVFELNLWQSCHSNKEQVFVAGCTCFLTHLLAKSALRLARCSVALYLKYTLCCSVVLTSVQLHWLLPWSFQCAELCYTMIYIQVQQASLQKQTSYLASASMQEFSGFLLAVWSSIV